MDPIKVEKVRVKNLLAIQDCELDLKGQLTTVSGGNAKGKSSIVEAFKTLLGGNDPTLVRDGAEEAEVYVKLSDGTEILKKIREKNPKLAVLQKTQQGSTAAIRAPQTFLDSLLGGSWFNPISFLLSSRKDRARLLLETVPMEFDKTRLMEIVDDLVEYETEAHPLKIIADVLKDVGKRALQEQALVKDKTKTIKKLREDNKVTAEVLDALTTEREKIEEEKNEVLKSVQKETTDIKIASGEKVEKIRSEWEATRKVVDNLSLEKIKEKEEQIATLKVELDDLRKTHEAFQVTRRDELNEKIDEETRNVNAALKDVEAKFNEKLAELKGRGETLNVEIDSSKAKAENLRTADLLDRDRMEAEKKAQKHMLEIDGLERYRKELLEKMPIPHLEVRDSDVYYNGHPFDRLSSAEQIQLSVDLSTLNLGSFRFVVLDGAERLDSSMFQLLREKLESSDIQALVTKVADGELEVDGTAIPQAES